VNFGGGHHASFPQKPVIKNYVYFQVTLFHAGIEDYATANTSLVSNDVQVIATSTNDQNLFAPCMVGTLESQFLKLQMQVSGAKKVLDIGTFTGKDI
jgi:predicted O-methyltransferase YrrM